MTKSSHENNLIQEDLYIDSKSRDELNRRHRTYDTSLDPNETISKSGSFEKDNVSVELSKLNLDAEFNFETRLFPWQKNVIQSLYDGYDFYIVAKPGAGKTTPVKAFWFKHHVFDLQNPADSFEKRVKQVAYPGQLFNTLFGDSSKIGRIVFVVPIRVLAREVFNGFVENFIDIFTYFREITPEFKQKWSDDYIRRMARRMIAVKTGGADPTPEGSGNIQTAPVIIMTYGSLENEINRLDNIKLIVFDEAHIYQPSEGTPTRGQESEYTAAKSLSKIIEIATKKKTAQIVFMSGTINPKTAVTFVRYYNKLYRRNMKVLPEESSGNLSTIDVIADDSLYDANSIVNVVVDAVKQKEKGIAVIVFSKNRIDDIIEKAKKKLNPSGYLLGVDESKKSNKYKRTSYGGGILLDKEPKKSKKELISQISKYPGAADIENQDVREAALHGIAYIYTEDETTKLRFGKSNITENDKLIVARLFSSGQLHVLLSTSAIGVGVNVSIKKMYLPTLEKPESVGYKNTQRMEISMRELAQLVNRTGRGAFKIATIYTPEKNVMTVLNALNAKITDFDDDIKAIRVEGRMKYSKAGFESLLMIIRNKSSEFADSNFINYVKHFFQKDYK